MTINFGVLPARSSFTVTRDADFYQVVRTSDGSNFPATATIKIVWLNAADSVLATWTATLDGSTAIFYTDEAVVAALLALSPVQGRLFYEDGAGGPELLLAKGPIRDESP